MLFLPLISCSFFIFVNVYCLDDANETAMDAINFLKTFDYLEEYNSSYVDSSELQTAIELFQERLNLSVTGEFNQETLEWMKKPRCGNTDRAALPFSVIPTSKFNNHNISWFYYGNISHMNTITAAFAIWAKHANLSFYRSIHNPNIIITMCGSDHVMQTDGGRPCSYHFDGEGRLLAHAFSPYPHSQRVDVHFDNSEHWEFNLVIPSYDKTSFFYVLVHELGHALGLSHSTQSNAVMFPWYGFPKYVTDINTFDLSRDDIFGIQ